MTSPKIAVLLPVRLETRFLPPSAQQPWRLRVRVVPDAVSINDHDEVPSALELDAVEALWRDVGGADLESPAGRSAWRTLASAVGAERAAWLARTFPPLVAANGEISVARPTTTRTAMRSPRVVGLPPTIEIWLGRGGKPPVRSAVLTVVAEAVDLEFDDAASLQQPWWTSFAEAVRVGLATEIVLGQSRPMDIDVIYAVGIGGGDPGPLFTDQADSGRLGVVPAGSATNSVNGAAAVPTADVDTWRRLVRVGPAGQPGTVAASVALAGTARIRGVLGGDSDHRPLNRALVGALWPALWGHTLVNVWGYRGLVDPLGLWAADNLVPEGPLPTIRVSDQPYGLLPVTALNRWRAADGDPAVEERLVPLIAQLVTRLAAAAVAEAAQATADGLGGLVHTPAATRFGWRWMMPTTLAEAVGFRFNQAVDSDDLDRWWDQRAQAMPRLDPTTTPARRLVMVGWRQDLGLRLAEPDDLPAGTDLKASLARLADASAAELLAAGPTDSGRPQAPWGTSLLTELARHSLVASAAAVARSAAGEDRAVVEPPGVNRLQPTETERWARRLRPPDLVRRTHPTIAVRQNVIDGLRVIGDHPLAEVERGLRATLEVATNRIDAWATAIAWRRLQSLAAAPRSLGIYSWVDAPRPRATDGDHHYLLGLSREHATVGAILRDRALRDPDADRWQIDLGSDTVRAALRLASETREGGHPAESLGRQVEAILARTALIDKVRTAFPTLSRARTRADFLRRRVCSGVAVLEAAEHEPARLTALGVPAAKLTAIRELGRAVDALADLQLAEATLGVVRKRTASVAAATGSAAGQGLPPDLTIVRTPRTGRIADSVALLVLPEAASPTDAQPSPLAVADPAVAAYLDERSGDPGGGGWTWTTLDENGQPVGAVTLGSIGLRPCDTAGIGAATLAGVVQEASGADRLAGDPVGHATVRALATMLAGVPAVTQDAGGPAEEADRAIAELARRYIGLRAAAVKAVANARQVASNGSAVAQRRALTRLARWGIVPMSATVDDPAIGSVADRVVRAADVLERRLTEAPGTLDDLTLESAAQTVAGFAAPDGPCPIFGRVPVSAFSELRLEPANPAAAGPRLDPDWLEVVATVRPALARIEADQLQQRLAGNGRALRSWSSRPGDPWQTTVPAPSEVDVNRPTRLVAVFGPPDALPPRPKPDSPGTVAAAVIDRFAETIPDPEQVSSVAFPHDIPTARAPQAVLLAVPPAVDVELDGAVLVDIVAEGRQLARARMANTTQAGLSAGVLHLAALPALGRVGVDLGGR